MRLTLAGDADDSEGKRRCLEAVLELNPDSQAARAGLALLRQREVSGSQGQRLTKPLPTLEVLHRHRQGRHLVETELRVLIGRRDPGIMGPVQLDREPGIVHEQNLREGIRPIESAPVD